MPLLFGAAMALAAFVAVNLCVSLVAAALALPLLATERPRDPARRARALLALRLLPGLASAVVVAALVVPAFLLFEPADTGESLTLPLAALAVAAVALIVGGLVRGLRSIAVTQALVRRWKDDASPVALAGSPVPAYRVRDAFPFFSVVGLGRARIYVAAQVLEALTPEELAAALAHERAHLRAHDNVKRLLLRACPDALGFSGVAGAIEREWARSAEAAADGDAARGDTRVALDLASGILKVARLVPGGAAPLSLNALHDGHDAAARVRRLMATDSATDRAPAAGRWVSLAVAAAILGLGTAATLGPLLPAVHRWIEVAAVLLR